MTLRPPPPPRTKSGEHPAVAGYRAKLDSIADGTAEDLEALNRRLSEYLKSSHPPPDDDEPTPETKASEPDPDDPPR